MNQLITQHLDVWTSAIEKKSSAGRGNGGPVSLYGIKKLRGLILELAVRGKLVSQNPADEPAAKWLAKLYLERSQSTKTIRSPKSKSIEPTQPLFDAPSGWEWSPLSTISNVIRGVTYKKTDVTTSERAGSIPLLRGNNIDRQLNYEELVYVTPDLVREEQIIQRGDIVIAMSSGSANLVGKAAQSDDDILKTFGAFCGVVRPNSPELIEYFRFFFQTPLYRSATQAAGKGIGINNLNKSALEHLWVPLPPLAEQHRIVAKVDELMGLCDALEAQTEESLKAHQTLVETCLATLTNSQTPEDLAQNWTRIKAHFDALFTTEDSIAALEASILTLATQGAFAECFLSGNPKGDLPIGWKWVTISDLDPEFQNGASSRGMKNGEPTVVLRLADITANKVDLSETRELQMDASSKSKYSLHENDFLIIRVNGSANLVGRFIRCDADLSAIYCDHFIRMRNISSDVDPRYLELVAQSGSVRKQIEGLFVSTAGQKTVNQKHIRSVRFALPPKQEQLNIITTVKGLLKVCSSLRGQFPKENQIAALLSDVLTSKIH